MNKGDLVEKIAKDANVSKVQATAALNSAIDGMTAALKKGGRVTLVGFGTFSVSSRKARTGRNPQTGAALKIPARRVPRFASGAELKKAVNRGR
jgi:DNA-binding protein HU-beta